MRFKGLYLSLLGLSLSSGIVFNVPNKTYHLLKADDEVLEKTIYVDVSSIDGLSNISIKHLDNEYPLNNVSNTLYSGLLPLEVLSDAENGFKVVGDEFESVLINNEALLSKNSFNYIHLYNDKVEYGYYGEAYTDIHTYNNQRVWLYIEGSSEASNHMVCYSLDNKSYVASFTNVYMNGYYYADIPYSVSSLSFITINNHIVSKYYDIDALEYGVCYASSSELTNVEAAPVKGASASLIARVVEAYLTYGKDASNGCVRSTVKNLFETWFKNKNATKAELKKEKIKDYTGYAANQNSYIGLEKSAEFSVNEKWNTMCSQAGIDPNTGANRSMIISLGSDKKGIIIFGGFFAIVAFGGFVLLTYKKKHRKE